jgi:hypothetical protein
MSLGTDNGVTCFIPDPHRWSESSKYIISELRAGHEGEVLASGNAGSLRMRRFLRRGSQSLGAGNGLALNRALAAGVRRTSRVKERVVIVESEFSSVHTSAPVAIRHEANVTDEGKMAVYVTVSKGEMPASDAGARSAQVMVVFDFVSGGIALLGSTPGYSSCTPPG